MLFHIVFNHANSPQVSNAALLYAIAASFSSVNLPKWKDLLFIFMEAAHKLSLRKRDTPLYLLVPPDFLAWFAWFSLIEKHGLKLERMLLNLFLSMWSYTIPLVLKMSDGNDIDMFLLPSYMVL